MQHESTDTELHTYVNIRHPDGKTTRAIKTSSSGSKSLLTTDEQLLLAMLANIASRDAEIAALKGVLDTLKQMMDWEPLDPALLEEVIHRALNPALGSTVQPSQTSS